jgi:3-oxoacyl-[acyl-carrier-protein] synthase-3
LPFERLMVTVSELGNIASATLPTQLALALERGLVQRGDRVMLAGLAGGVSMGVMLATL